MKLEAPSLSSCPREEGDVEVYDVSIFRSLFLSYLCQLSRECAGGRSRWPACKSKVTSSPPWRSKMRISVQQLPATMEESVMRGLCRPSGGVWGWWGPPSSLRAPHNRGTRALPARARIPTSSREGLPALGRPARPSGSSLADSLPRRELRSLEQDERHVRSE